MRKMQVYGKNDNSVSCSDECSVSRAAGASSLRVLVVEDSQELQLLIRLTLEGQDFDVDYARDGQEALASFEESPPQLILLDIGLPGYLSGLELCARFRSAGIRPFPIIVMLTADDAESTIERAREHGADGYLVKPVSPIQVLGLLDTFDAWRLDDRRPVPRFWPGSAVGH
jgi:CheY-like chemotaxis protein